MKKIQVVAAVIINGQGKYLCVQRGANKYDYIHEKWEFPGGKIEEGETHIDALKRELSEELDIEIIKEPTKIITVEHQYPDFHLTMHAYLCHILDSPINLKEHIDSKWLTITKMDVLDWAAADLPIVSALKA